MKSSQKRLLLSALSPNTRIRPQPVKNTFVTNFSSEENLSTWFEKIHRTETLVVWASYQVRKIVDCACAGIAGKVFPATNFKGNRGLAIDMHHGTCVTHMLWCMSGSVTRGGEKNSIPGACATCNFVYMARVPLCNIMQRMFSLCRLRSFEQCLS